MLLVWILLYPHVVVALLSAPLNPSRFGSGAWMALGFASYILLLAATGNGLHLGRATGLIRPCSQRLRAIGDATSARMGMKRPNLYEASLLMANALALPFRGSVVFTDAALRGLSGSEVDAILAHELGHIEEPWPVKLVRVVTAMALLPLIAVHPVAMTYGKKGVAAIGLIFLAVVFAARVFGRRMEARADRFARAHELDSGGYARALESIYRLNLVPAVLGRKRMVHPELDDRMLAGGVQPEYARPEAPSNSRTSLAVVAGLAVPFLGLPPLYAVFLFLVEKIG